MSQSLACILVHIIFSTKHRQKFIQPVIKDELFSYMGGILHHFGTASHAIGGVEDHVHIMTTLPRKISLSSLIEEIKKSSSRWIKTKGNSYQHFSWQSGYGAFSIGQSSFETCRNYILNQEKHHKKVTFQDELRAFLNNYNIPYNEKYIWD